MSKADRTRQHIIERTAPLFNTKGYEATSLKDIQDATGLTKGSLYGNFTDKDEIATQAFKYAINHVKETVRRKLDGVNTYKKQLIALFDFYAEYVFDSPIPGGCPLLNSAIEVDDYRTSMRRVVVKELMNTVNFIAVIIEKGIESGEFKKGTKSKELAYTFFCCIEGAIMYSRVERSSEPMDIIIRHCKSIVENISK